MALLQLSEPGQTPAPHQRRIAVGIDLGTTHSLVASVRNSVAECPPDAQDPQNTIASVKRLMGRGIQDIGNRAQLPYQLIDQPGMVTVANGGGRKKSG